MSLKETIILPEGVNQENKATKTYRERVRETEDRNYLPVIIKRIDEAVRHPNDILEKAIHEGIEQHKRTNLSLMLSSLSAGLILGFAAMCVALASQIYSDSFIMDRLMMALVYPLGVIICIMSGTQLFTEHTATAVYPILDKKANMKSLLRLWAIVLGGNLLGTFLSSYLIASSDTVIHAAAGFNEVSGHLLSFSFYEVVLSGVLAGWLMAQGGWLIHSSPTASGQIFCIYIVTFIIGLAGLHHSIAGSAEIFGSFFLAKDPQIIQGLSFILAAVIGNLLGGSIFVAILNYAHIKRS